MSLIESPTDSMLHRFAGISLTEMNERAELQTRVDRKYLVDIQLLEQLGDLLNPDSQVLEIEGSRRANYRSVYFDTPDLLSFHQAARGRRRRFKLRTRAYCDSGIAFLEAKTKGTRGVTAKERITHSFDALETLDSEAREYASGVMYSVGEPRTRGQELAAVLATGYQRSTILVPATPGTQEDTSRVTIDTALTWEKYGVGAEVTQMYRPDLAIIETKSGMRPSLTDRALWQHGVRPLSFSKYATGLAAMTPDLPANRWSRILRRRFPHERRHHA